MNETLESPAQEADLIEVDGLLVNQDGEIVGHVAPDGGRLVGEAPAAETIDEGMANWILRKMLARKAQRMSAAVAEDDAATVMVAIVEAAVAKAKNEPAYIEASQVLEGAQRIQHRAMKELEWLTHRFKDALRGFAELTLAGGKTKTWVSPFGSLGLRSVPAKLEIADEAKFIAWARLNCPQAVKETPLISKLPKDAAPIADLPAEDGDEGVDGNGLSLVPARNELTITPGVK